MAITELSCTILYWQRFSCYYYAGKSAALSEDEKRTLRIIFEEHIELHRSLSQSKIAEILKEYKEAKDIDPKAAHEFLKAEVVKDRNRSVSLNSQSVL